MMIMVSIICVIVVALIIGLSLLTTSKGYAYKHKVDPHPDDLAEQQRDEREQQKEANAQNNRT
ncbi:YtzI protein [Sediminibacillus dalangtanensis]|uniref:YtzI protein n=1 Tax=Sediminibacillus dalangtanensis TaxID=2729421 RepID=A0ABX7VTU6_9BACI|nr:YtzI protein [Sediminibacillus dalangtanensis]QTM98006.1 YtzI protein [Sediminibacillus dalangtanensis]